MIEKPTIVITSLGRTGTRFFALLFKEIMPNSISLHEPDVFQVVVHGDSKVRRSIVRVREQLREVGARYLVLRKALGRWSLIQLSDARVCGAIGHDEALSRLLEQRAEFVDSRSGDAYVESNTGYYGVVDLLGDVYEHCKVAYIIRDGRDWVRSKMNWGEMYGKGKIRGSVAHTWPAASDVKGDPYATTWDSMSRFERTCWAWVRLNEYALDTVERNPSARVFRFEDIFKSKDRYEHLAALVDFATDLPGVEPVPSQALDGWLDRKIHGSSGEFPAWPEWSSEQQHTFVSMGGPLMEELGYRIE